MINFFDNTYIFDRSKKDYFVIGFKVFQCALIDSFIHCVKEVKSAKVTFNKHFKYNWGKTFGVHNDDYSISISVNPEYTREVLEIFNNYDRNFCNFIFLKAKENKHYFN